MPLSGSRWRPGASSKKGAMKMRRSKQWASKVWSRRLSRSIASTMVSVPPSSQSSARFAAYWRSIKAARMSFRDVEHARLEKISRRFSTVSMAMLSSLRDPAARNSSSSSGGRGVDWPMESSTRDAMPMSFSFVTVSMPFKGGRRVRVQMPV